MSFGVSPVNYSDSDSELTDVDFSFQKFHWLFENNETNQGYRLTAFGYFKEMNNYI